MKGNILKLTAIFVLGVIGGIFGSQILWPYFIERPLFYAYDLNPSPIYLTENKTIIVQENTALKEAIREAEKSVIGIKAANKIKVLQGSGLIATSDGLVVTLADLVPAGSAFNLFIEGEKVKFQVLKRDLKENLALIKIEKEGLSTVSFADLEKITAGERVFLAGFIFDKTGESPVLTVNEGIIKSLNKDFIKTNIFEKGDIEGSSLFDIKGNFIGLNTVSKDGEVITIPVSKVKDLLGF